MSSGLAPSRSAATDIALVDEEISYGHRSLRYVAPEGWRSRVVLRNGERNRTFITSPDGAIVLIVEISDATSTSPRDSAYQHEQSKRDKQHKFLGVRPGPGAGATWEYTYVDNSTGLRRHAQDWFATVGATDLALFVSAPPSRWPTAVALWQRMVDRVRPGDQPPAYSGPSQPTASPVSSTPVPEPTPSSDGPSGGVSPSGSASPVPSDGVATAAPSPDPGPLDPPGSAAPEQASPAGPALQATRLRIGEQPTFQRFVLDLSGSGVPGWSAAYGGSPGGADTGDSANGVLTVVVSNVTGTIGSPPTLPDGGPVSDYTVKQTPDGLVLSFTTGSSRPFRVFRLGGDRPRVVVDIAATS